jgi:AcrR family transcriptional regulator
MDSDDGDVKHKRTYDATRRQAEADRSRGRILACAERMFLRDGYATTAITAIAASADVSVATIYKSFGGKAGLVRAIRTRALEGAGPVPAERRSDELHEPDADPHAIVRAWGALSAEVAPRVSPMLLLLRDAAAVDSETRTLLEELDADRLRRMTRNARRLHDAGHLRAGVALAEASDVLWTFSSPELYELLVLRRGWSSERYGHFIAEAMIQALL